MDYRSLGASGLNVPVIGLGTSSLGVAGPGGGVPEKAAARLIDLAIERGAAFIDVLGSDGSREELVGKLLAKRRKQVLIACKVGHRTGSGPNDAGASRHHLIEACEAALRRLGTDYIDVLQIDGFDARTPVEETIVTIERLIAEGKVRYGGCSDYTGWQLMKSLAASERHGLAKFVSHRVSWSLAMRDAEWDLMPLGADQEVASLVWAPLAGGLLSGKYGRDTLPVSAMDWLGATPEAQLHDIIDCIGEVAKESGVSPAQVSLAWLMQRPTVATVFVGARNEAQLEDALGAIRLQLTGDQLVRLDEVSARPARYPHSLQRSHGAERAMELRPAVNVRVDKTWSAEKGGT